MQSYLAKCLEKLTISSNQISQCVFVLPSKRAGVFLKKELAQYYNKTIFLPEIISIEELVESISGLKSASNLEVLFAFYEVYCNLVSDDLKESFSSFSKWAQILLHDFNEVDRYKLNAEQFFSNLANIKQIEQWSPNAEPTTLINNYLNFWKNAYQYYHELQKKLLNTNVGYQGLVYREASNQIEHYIQSVKKEHYFLGFNALNSCEEIIFQEFLAHNQARVLWDVDAHFLNTDNSSIVHFFNKYKRTWNYYNNNDFSIISNEFIAEKFIDVIALPKNVGQVKKVGELLSTLPQEELQQTAVVLGDESLLLALLNSLPTNVKNINITMGMSLKDIPLTAFFESLFQLFIQQSGKQFYYKKLLTFLTNNYTKLLFGASKVEGVITYIHENNIIYLSKENIIARLDPDETLKKIFYLSENISHISSTVTSVIYVLKGRLSVEEHQLDLEYLYRYNEIFNVLATLQESYKTISNFEEFYQVYKEVLGTETLDFKGEPIRGLQIMGMLESRVLDFNRVIVTSVNEGILPSGKSSNSFIPFDLKREFDLPTYYEKDAVYAYHFFHLLQRAKNVTILYNTEPDGLNAGEKSRFLLQLETMLTENHQISYQTSAPTIPKNKSIMQSIVKDEQVLMRLIEIAKKGFSPSSLTQYIRNPIDFYKQKVLRIYDENEVEETVAANTLGTIVHNTLEEFYKPLENQVLSVDIINKMQSQIDEEVEKQFNKEFKKGDITTGKNLIIFNIAKRYVSNFLKQELRLLANSKEVVIRKIETDLKTQLHIPELNFPVYITGKVDRIDEVDGVIRIIDYKTGKVEQNKVEIVNWQAITTDYTKYSKPFQILAYAYMIEHQKIFKQSIEAGIISFKNLNAGFLKFAKKDREGRGANKTSVLTKEIFDAYLIELNKLILEICNINVPFIEKEV